MKSVLAGLPAATLILASSLAAQIPLQQQPVSFGDPTNFPNEEWIDFGGQYIRFAIEEEINYGCFDNEAYAGWAYDSSQPLSHVIHGAFLMLADSEGSTPNTVTVQIYPEDPAFPGQPLFGQPLSSTIVTVSGNGATGQPDFFEVDVVFPNPVVVPAGQEVYLGMRFAGLTPAAGETAETATDFMFFGAQHQDVSQFPAGSGFTNADVLGGNVQVGHGLGTLGGGHAYLELPTRAAGGQLFFTGFFNAATFTAPQATFMVAAETSQATVPSSNPGAAPGFIGGGFSARHPALVTDRTGVARTDNLRFIYHNDDPSLQSSVATLGVVLMAPLGLSPAPIAADLILPGSTGALAIDLSVVVTVFQTDLTNPAVDVNGNMIVPLDLPTDPAGMAARAGVAGLPFAFTGMVADFQAGTVDIGAAAIVTM